MAELFSREIVARALGANVAGVDVVEPLQAGVNHVARLTIRFADGRPELHAIGKAARGDGVAAVRRELAFFARVAPGWDSRAPALLGAVEDHDALVLLTEDLTAAGYALVAAAVTPAQVRGALDALAVLHARFWNAIPADYLADDAAASSVTSSVTRCARAWPPASIARNAAAVRATRLTAASELTRDERALLDDLLATSPARFAARAAPGRALTLIHADYHFFGNVLFADDDPRPRIIDWSELKPGLGPHDVSYCLAGAPAEDRATRDLAMLDHYWRQLRALGVSDYDWPLCVSDFRLSLIHHAFQALFQDSVHWLRRSLAAIRRHGASLP